jgi:hypothetical protein
MLCIHILSKGIIIIWVNFPTVRVLNVIEFPLHVLEDLVLERCHLPLPAKHALIAGHEHVKADKLPLGQALGLLDIRKGIATKGPSLVFAYVAVFTVFTLDHLLPQRQIRVIVLAGNKLVLPDIFSLLF